MFTKILEYVIGPKTPLKSVPTFLLNQKYGGLTSEIIYFSFLNETDSDMVTTQGSFLSGYEFRGYDLSSSISEELNRVVRELNRSLRELGEGWSIHVDIQRKPSTGYIPREESFFPHPTAEVTDLEREQYYSHVGNHFENKSVINFCWLLPNEIQVALNNLFYKSDAKRLSSELGIDNEIDKYLSDYHFTLRKLFSTIETVFPYFRKLNRQEYFSYIGNCIDDENQNIELPEDPVFLQRILGSKDIIVENYPKIGNKYIQTLTVYGIDGKLLPGILDMVNSLDIEFRFNTRFIFVTPEKAKKEIDKLTEKWKLKKKGFWSRILDAFNINSGKEDPYAQAQQDEVESNLPLLQTGQTTFGYYTSTFILMGEDLKDVQKRAEYLYGILKVKGFKANIEGINNVEAFIGSWPGYTYENCVQLPFWTHQLCNVLPITGLWTGADRCPNPLFLQNGGNNPPLALAQTSGSTPFKLNLHVKQNGNTCVIGDSSTLLNFIALQSTRYKRAKVFIFDVGYNSLITCKGMDGAHVEVFEQNQRLDSFKYKLQPLADIDQLSEFTWAEKWLQDIVSIYRNGSDLQIHDKEAIRESLRLLSGENVKHNRTLEGFTNNLVDAEGDLKKAFNYYVNGAGSMLNGDSDTVKTSDFTVFEIKHLLDTDDPKIIVPVLTYLFHKVEGSITGAPILVMFPKVGELIKYELFAKKLGGWLYEMESKNVYLYIEANDIKTILDSSLDSTILSRCVTKILLPNYAAGTEQLKPYYEKIGLNKKQINIVVNMTEKRDYYILAERDKRVFDFGFESTPVTKAFISKNTESDLNQARKLIDELEEKYGNPTLIPKGEFAKAWLRKLDLNDGASAIEELLNRKEY